MRLLRLATWLPRVVAAAAFGAAVRLGRRLTGKPPRIWHGPHPIHAIKAMVTADRFAGYPSRSVVFSTRQIDYALVTTEDFDVVIGDENVAWDDVHWLALIDLLRNGDVWVAYFDDLFFHTFDRRANTAVFRLIRFLGIRIVVTAHGSDIVQLGFPPTRYDWISRFQQDYPQWSFEQQTPISRERIAYFTKFADLVLPADAVMARLLPRSDLLFKD